MDKNKEPILFISLGPSDPELVTLKGLKALQKADVILTPSTINNKGEESSRSESILLTLGIEKNKIKLFHVPMSKDRTVVMQVYRTVANMASEYYSEGLHVAIVAEGDAGFYSSSQYINDYLTAMNMPTRRIAGVPAFIACGALANIHIAKQEEQVVVIPGVTSMMELIRCLGGGKSIVIMKPSQSEEIIKELLDVTDDVQYHYFENAGVGDKEFYTSDKEEIRGRKFPYFSLLIIQ